MHESVIFHASKTKAALLFLGSIAFVALGAWLRAEVPWVGWACMLFFGLGIPASLVMAFSNKMYLRLDEQGFEMGSPVKTTRIGWTDVDGFEMVSLKGARMIAIHYSGSYEAQRALRGGVKAVSGIEGAISNLYTEPLPSLLRHLRNWHAHYGRPTA
jgi:hypothetical protein